MKLVTKWIFGFLVIGFIVLSVTTTKAQYQNGGEWKTAYVDIVVATLWTDPEILRPLDEPSATNPVNLRKWTTSMTYEEKLWLVGNLETQALLGSKVTILEEQGDWVKVAAHKQPTPRHELGYPGWMPKAQLTDGKKFSKLKQRHPTALIVTPTTWLYEDKNKMSKFKEISINTRLPVLKVAGDMLLVATPSNGNQWLDKKNAKVYQFPTDIPPPSAKELIQTAKQFLGLPYLWAGTSGFGFDCSGFTHTVYRTHGIIIPRDSSVQATHGTTVSRENLQVGDLIFFAYNKGKGRVHHVGMYIGNGKMIHSPNTSSTVRIDAYDAPGYGEEYAGARRYLN